METLCCFDGLLYVLERASAISNRQFNNLVLSLEEYLDSGSWDSWHKDGAPLAAAAFQETVVCVHSNQGTFVAAAASSTKRLANSATRELMKHDIPDRLSIGREAMQVAEPANSTCV